MTATPIPRSLALTQYGDMDLSVLDEKPPGRTPRRPTPTVPVTRMDDVVAKLRAAVAEGRQAYWVCPLVEESEVVDTTSAEERFRALRAALGEDVVGLVHGQMPPAEKDAAMAAFVSGRTGVLVATTVIEVGVDVPNASIMVIERAETFGLAQLHQLRGPGRAGGGRLDLPAAVQAPARRRRPRRGCASCARREDGFRISEEDLAPARRGRRDRHGAVRAAAVPRRRSRTPGRSDGGGEPGCARAAGRRSRRSQGPRGAAARMLLWLTEQDRALRLLSVG